MEKSKFKPEHALMETMGFTDEDLAANQQGYLSQRQRGIFARKRQNIILGIVFLGCFIVFAALTTTVRFLNIINILFYGVPGLVAIFYLVPMWRKQDQDFQAAAVETVEGRVRLDVQRGSKGSGFSIQVQDQQFIVKKDIFLSFKNGDPYVLYYAPSTRMLLSAEWLRE